MAHEYYSAEPQANNNTNAEPQTDTPVQEALRRIVTPVTRATIYCMLKGKDGYGFRKLNVENQKAQPAATALFKDYLSEHILNKEELRICSMQNDDGSDDALYHFDFSREQGVQSEPKSEIDAFGEFINALSDGMKLDPFIPEDDMSQLFAFVILFDSGKEKVFLFKRHYPSAIVQIKPGLFKIKSDGILDILDEREKNIISLSGAFQMFWLEGEIYVLDPDAVMKMPRMDSWIGAKVAPVLETIEKLNILALTDALDTAFKKTSIQRKLLKAKNSKVLSCTADQIISFVKNDLNDLFDVDQNTKRINLPNQKAVNTFVKLLTDSYLFSKLTETTYVASKKYASGSKTTGATPPPATRK